MGAMHDDEWFELLSAAADDQLAPHERARVAEHLDHCERCASTVAVMQAQRRRARIHQVAAPGELVDAVTGSGVVALGAAQRARSQLARRLSVALVAVVATCAGLAALTAGTGPAPAAPEVVLVAAHDASFDQADITVPVGSTVRFRNDGANTHQLVTELEGATVSGSLEPGSTEATTFTEAGEYTFRCDIHEGMTGTVTVSA
jgi:plastocyanin